MTDRTITALYATRSEADAARQELASAGYTHGIDIHDQSQTGSSVAGGGFMERFKEFFGDHEDAHAYGEGLSRGHFLLTAKVDDDDADEVARILEGSTAVDFDQTQTTWRNEGWTGAAAAAPSTPASSTAAASGQEEVIPVYEEQLRVGKREVERGGVRVRSYVVEAPVHEQIGLHEEHVSIERRPVDRVIAAGDAAFEDRDIELTETAEEAVVAKDTVVREEVVVRREGSDRVEDINDTVRHTEVDVEDTTNRTSSAPLRGA